MSVWRWLRVGNQKKNTLSFKSAWNSSIFSVLNFAANGIPPKSVSSENSPNSPTPDKLKSTDKLKPEHITVFWYVKILRGCIVASLVRFFTREATIHPLRILTYQKTVMCSVSIKSIYRWISIYRGLKN